MNSRITTFLSSLGAGLEYFDFIIYAMLAGYISELFFPSSSKYMSLIETFGVFAAGYFVRPVGGVIFGAIGDKYGRKVSFVIVMVLMSTATFAMGVLPAYSNIGIYAALLFIFFRLLQGISFGAELPCAITFISEHAGKKYRAVHCGVLLSFVTFGVIMGMLVIYLLSTYFSNEEILKYAWRIPFLFGSVLAIITFLIRLWTKETSLYIEQEEKPDNAFLILINDYVKEIFIGIGIMLLPSAMVMFVMCMPSYFANAYGFKTADIYYAITIGYIWCMISLPVFSFLSDLITRKVLLLISSLVFIIAAIYMFKLLLSGTFYNLVVFLLLYQTFISSMSACFFPMLAENFPTKVRYTGIAFCYNITYAAASTIPVITNFMYEKTNNVKYIIIILIFIAVITLVAAGLSEDKTGETLPG